MHFLSIIGTTASGKTRLAVRLAQALDAEIVSADSRQVYCHMDLGTGKDLDDYTLEGERIPYHLIDIAAPGEKYNLFRFQSDFLRVYEEIRQRKKGCIVCGGSGLYVESLVRSYQISEVPENKALRAELAHWDITALKTRLAALKAQNGQHLHNHSEIDSPQRAIRAIEIETHNLHLPTGHRAFPHFDTLIVALDLPRQERRQRISERLEARLKAGMVDEVRSLLARGVSAEDLIYYGLEYKFVTLHVLGELSYEQMHQQLEIAIHQFAKRQMTWFRGMERRGCTLHWIDALQSVDQQVQQVLTLLKTERPLTL